MAVVEHVLALFCLLCVIVAVPAGLRAGDWTVDLVARLLPALGL